MWDQKQSRLLAPSHPIPLTLQALTGVSSSGVEMGEQSPLSLMPLPRSKSQIFTGETWEGLGRGSEVGIPAVGIPPSVYLTHPPHPTGKATP